MAKSDEKKKRRRDDDAAGLPPMRNARKRQEEEAARRRRRGPAQRAAPTTKKKKKPRWRDQRALTLVVTQLSYEADADAVAEALAVDGRRPTVRLVTDQAASANNRKHAGLAYAVYDTAGDATTAASKTYSVNGRAVQIKPLDADHDETGRRTAAAKEKKGSADAQAVDQYIVEKGLDGVLDAGVKAALRGAGYRVACRVCRDVAKALSTGDVENPSAYALGVLRNAADAPAYRLSAAHVDALIDQSVAAAPDKLGRADVDQRCRSYMREFPKMKWSTRSANVSKDGPAGHRLGVGLFDGPAQAREGEAYTSGKGRVAVAKEARVAGAGGGAAAEEARVGGEEAGSLLPSRLMAPMAPVDARLAFARLASTAKTCSRSFVLLPSTASARTTAK